VAVVVEVQMLRLLVTEMVKQVVLVVVLLILLALALGEVHHLAVKVLQVEMVLNQEKIMEQVAAVVQVLLVQTERQM
jgi:hypothetical protein